MIQKSGKVITGFRIDEPRVKSFRGRGFDTVVREQKADDPIANRAPEPSEGEQSWPCKDIYDLSILWEESLARPDCRWAEYIGFGTILFFSSNDTFASRRFLLEGLLDRCGREWFGYCVVTS